MTGAYPKNGPNKTNWESMETRPVGRPRQMMARRCHGRSKRDETQKLEGDS
jgi:hypothetical protein